MSLLLHMRSVRKMHLCAVTHSLYQDVTNSLKALTEVVKIETAMDANCDQQIIDFIYDNTYPRSSERKPTRIGHGAFSSIEDIPLFLSDRVSLVAIDIEKNRIVGVAINSVLDDKKLFDRPTANIGVKAYRSCVKKLLMSENVLQRKKAKQGMDLVYLGVKECFERRGLALNLAQHSIRLAQERQLDFIQSVTICPETLNIFERLKFETLNKCKLMDYRIGKEKSFPNAGPDDFIYLTFKML